MLQGKSGGAAKELLKQLCESTLRAAHCVLGAKSCIWSKSTFDLISRYTNRSGEFGVGAGVGRVKKCGREIDRTLGDFPSSFSDRAFMPLCHTPPQRVRQYYWEKLFQSTRYARFTTLQMLLFSLAQCTINSTIRPHALN